MDIFYLAPQRQLGRDDEVSTPTCHKWFLVRQQFGIWRDCVSLALDCQSPRSFS